MTRDLILVPCGACGSEGRLYHEGHGIDYRNGDRIGDWSEECQCCGGTGGEIIDAETPTEEEIVELDRQINAEYAGRGK